jgi:hypothetical protein
MDLQFNTTGAFLGMAVDKVANHPKESEPDPRTILYETILAAPYISILDGFSERKWLGTNQAGDNKNCFGAVIDAFAHHTLIDSNSTAVLVDLQG